jgi:hypothetical protein
VNKVCRRLDIETAEKCNLVCTSVRIFVVKSENKFPPKLRDGNLSEGATCQCSMVKMNFGDDFRFDLRGEVPEDVN